MKKGREEENGKKKNKRGKYKKGTPSLNSDGYCQVVGYLELLKQEGRGQRQEKAYTVWQYSNTHTLLDNTESYRTAHSQRQTPIIFRFT
jgi:hypothetical protein